MPLTLAGALLPLPGLLAPAHGLLEAAMVPLEALSALPFAVIENAAAPVALVACASAGAFVLLAPRGLPMRAAGATLVLPFACFVAPSPAPGAAWIDVLDVGQGLAVVVRTATHALAYDAGPAWTAESDSGNRIVVPFLRGEGIRRLDGLVVTHADDDHAGGAASVAKAREPAWLMAVLPEGDERLALAPVALACVAGMRWAWDGVDFEVLHPAAEALRDRRRENDRSCVLRVDAASGSALLAADIERRAEGRTPRALARAAEGGCAPRAASRLAHVVAAGFRGRGRRRRLAIVSAGWRNRFRQPSPEVEARYRERGAAILRTDLLGAVHVELPAPVRPAGRRPQPGRAQALLERAKRRGAVTALQAAGSGPLRRSSVRGKRGLRASSGSSIGPGVCPMASNRATRRASASSAFTGKVS